MSKSRTRAIASVATMIGGLAATPAGADLVTASDIPTGSAEATVMIDGVETQITASGGTLESRTNSGVTALGVIGDGSRSIRFDFAAPVTITGLDLSSLYPAYPGRGRGNQFANSSNDTARLTVNDANDFYLEAASAGHALWSGEGRARNTSPGNHRHAGAWSVSGNNLFGGPVTSLTFSGDLGDASGQGGGYGVQSMSAEAMATIPAPGAALLLAGAVCVLGRRRRA